MTRRLRRLDPIPPRLSSMTGPRPSNTACSARTGPSPGRGPHQPEYPAWDLVAREYDAVHLTDDGQWATRLTHPISLYGWDCESTLWFRWMFTTVDHHGTWNAPTGKCPQGEDCWRCHGSGIHYLSRYDRQQESADA